MTYYSKHYSKKDGWLVAVVAVGFLFPLLLGTYLWIEKDWSPSLLNVFIGSFLMIGIFVGLLYPLHYEIDDSTLTIRSGLTRKKIPILSIRQVSPSNDWNSAPAWSLDRLRIDWESTDPACATLVSPEDKMKFLQDLNQVDPELEVRGNTLVRSRKGGC